MTPLVDESDLVPLSAMQHYLFCPRQCALIHIERLWAENVLTAEGRILHESSDKPGQASRSERRIVHGMPVRSLALGVAGVADVVELTRDGKRWYVDGAHRADLDGLLDVDLEASAMTNTVPVHRTDLADRTAAPAVYVRLDGSVRRLMGNQDLTAAYEGCNLDGHFAACLRSGEHEWTGLDFMRVSVERFVEAVRTGDPTRLLVDARAGLRHQEALVGIWEHCWHTPA